MHFKRIKPDVPLVTSLVLQCELSVQERERGREKSLNIGFPYKQGKSDTLPLAMRITSNKIFCVDCISKLGYLSNN